MQTTLDEKTRITINMSALKASSRIHTGEKNSETAIEDAKKFVDFIINYYHNNVNITQKEILICVRDGEETTRQHSKRLKELGFEFDWGKNKDDPHWRIKTTAENWNKIRVEPFFKKLRVWTNNEGGGENY